MSDNLDILIASKDLPRIFVYIIKDNPDNIIYGVLKILTKFRSIDDLPTLLFNLINILNKELFLWKYEDNIKLIFNVIEENSVEFLSKKYSKMSSQQMYNDILQAQFELLFENIKNYLEKEMNVSNIKNNCLSQCCIVLLNFTKLVDIQNVDSVLLPMTKFVETLLTRYLCYEVLHKLSIDILIHINHRLINYLAVFPGCPTSKGLNEAINIYGIVRKCIVNMIFAQPEVISNALRILEYRSRFFGLYSDAIPENQNHGDYIVIDPLNSVFEDDEVYNDYEKFLASLPN